MENGEWPVNSGRRDHARLDPDEALREE